VQSGSNEGRRKDYEEPEHGEGTDGSEKETHQREPVVDELDDRTTGLGHGVGSDEYVQHRDRRSDGDDHDCQYPRTTNGDLDEPAQPVDAPRRPRCRSSDVAAFTALCLAAGFLSPVQTPEDGPYDSDGTSTNDELETGQMGHVDVTTRYKDQ